MIRAFILVLSLLLPFGAQAAEKVSVALDWSLNTNHVGLVVARDRGFYADAGLDVELLPFSDTSSAALLAGGLADFAYVPSLGFMSARAAGADITALWVTMQRETGRLVYNAANSEISRPADLSGKTYAGFGSAWEAALIGTMIRNDGGTPQWDTVTLGSGAYEALASGAVDFTLEVATWEGVNSELLQRNQASFAYGDYGVPDQQNGFIATRGASIGERSETVASFMRATLAGYEWAAANPDEAAEIMIAAGDFPNPDLVRGSMKLIAEGGFLGGGDTPVGKIDGMRLQRMAQFLADNGVLKDGTGNTLSAPGDVSGWFDESWRGQ
ncbi:ABC transporter substrate-binding protein [Mesorhizobium sp. YM1C-6-2]|jgi:ABC-type nitrate/sulfonate/bicarbonate transport system substrate-binding protein|uniref:ABC transporter substrate-binding protein n=1 Tax=Mesorhizobium sp. YM1C-6-2 TaxID=1827501 RepID=UPI000EF19253|nr:ABC transporter substrate-binding protein [Mesorhizobium sp. YM1C-6-2]RLP26214.1 myristoyl transferase [Mesorhizobium sp. YM1C-6-2]